MTRIEAEPYNPHSVLMLDSKDFSPRGRVHNDESCRIWAATRYSDQAVMKEKRAVITRAGAASGRMTRRKAWNWVQPSMRAASSRLTGMVS